mmetsp:Transcript_11855/g.13673  ORF Transcript_11855/g.13673 Transcript_11855/m.13673 type:complete len:142 (-) Transcript_11855:463-888(-)|eukprot:CAMPEP_0184018216 /NCGR_PEP_ID=MMETSP0954-20121128/8015_1 /TAXON_ID=627963 /ORGANISM="Aplanochytrium sp, Strain PBS07" /LENGTH=141 /DNA_ID=CAMNT_0026299631 /DNA_START=44 /DNA_END=469 /DNA_ORIENTATION=-
MQAIAGFAPFSLATNGPVALTVGKEHPSLLLASCGLLFLLARDTISKPGDASSFLKEAEANRLQQLMITSDFNRYVRMAMGSINLLSSALYVYYAAKKTNDSSSEVKERSSSLSSETAQWLLTGWSCLIGAVWLSSGYYGQ